MPEFQVFHNGTIVADSGVIPSGMLVARGGRIEQIGPYDPGLIPAAAERIAGTVAAAAAALGMRAGTLSVEVVLGPRGPVLVELGTGLSGGYVGTHEVPLATGVDLVAAEIRLALGETPEPGALRARWCQGVARRFLLPAPGTVTSVRGAAEAAAARVRIVTMPGPGAAALLLN